MNFTGNETSIEYVIYDGSEVEGIASFYMETNDNFNKALPLGLANWPSVIGR